MSAVIPVWRAITTWPPRSRWKLPLRLGLLFVALSIAVSADVFRSVAVGIQRLAHWLQRQAVPANTTYHLERLSDQRFRATTHRNWLGPGFVGMWIAAWVLQMIAFLCTSVSRVGEFASCWLLERVALSSEVGHSRE